MVKHKSIGEALTPVCNGSLCELVTLAFKLDCWRGSASAPEGPIYVTRCKKNATTSLLYTRIIVVRDR
jgi:hypothetical protein